MDSLNNVIPVISHTYDEIESSMVRSSGVGLTDKFITRTFNEVTAKVFRINFSWDDNRTTHLRCKHQYLVLQNLQTIIK